MANVLPMETRVRIISALVEGNSIRAVERMTGVAKSTILRLAVDIGEGCNRLHNRLVRGLHSYVIECDEQWSFIHTKEKRVDPSKDPAEWGDVYTYVGMDANTKLIIAYRVGKRDQETTDAFIADLRARILVAPQLTSDGLSLYVPAIKSAFGGSVDYGQVVKNYRSGASRSPDYRYEPPRDPFITKTVISGVPDERRMSTSYVERLNLTTRHTVGRKRRLSLAFSKTLRGHRAAIALGFAAYNLTRIHGTLRVTPAMEARLTDHVWTMEELIAVALAEGPAEPPKAQPLALPQPPAGRPAVPARELPNGRGFLRLVKGESNTAPSSPVPPPPTPTKPAPHRNEQLSLFDRLDGPRGDGEGA